MRSAGLEAGNNLNSGFDESQFDLNYEELADNFHSSGIHYEGDILLTPPIVSFLEERGVDINHAEVDMTMQNRGASIAGEGVMIWNQFKDDDGNTLVPIYFDPAFNSTQISMIKHALTVIEDDTCLRFREIRYRVYS